MAKKKGKQPSNKTLMTVLTVAIVIIAIAVIVFVILYAINMNGIKDTIDKILYGNDTTVETENSNVNSGDNNNNSNNNNGDNNNNGGDNNPGGGGATPPSSLVNGEGNLQFHMIDIAQGDWLLLLLPDGKEMLVDAGSKPDSTSSYNTAKAYMDTYITDGQIDYVVLTHSDQDHVAYMDEIFRDYQVDNLYMPALYAVSSNSTYQSQIDAIPSEKMAILDNSGVIKDKCHIETATYAKFFIAAFTEPNCNIFLNLEVNADNNDTTLDANSKITSSDNTYSITFFFENLAFYNAKNFVGDSHQINGISPTMIVEYNGKRIVLTGDANEENEPDMVARMQAYYGGVIDCDVLKVAHHGSHEGSSNAYLDEVKCEYAMISCGAGNSYNHPRQVALNRLKAHNIQVYRTDLHGTIVCVIDKDGNITITPTNTNVDAEAVWIGPA